jgi:hypothetical protein
MWKRMLIWKQRKTSQPDEGVQAVEDAGEGDDEDAIKYCIDGLFFFTLCVVEHDDETILLYVLFLDHPP